MIHPSDRLLYRYFTQGHYVDCFTRTVPDQVTLERFITGFYGSWLFGLERLILRLIGRGSRRAEIIALAKGEIHSFAAWHVEDRSDTQILLQDMHGSTASWLAVEPTDAGTTLYFGSAVVFDQGRKPWWFRPMIRLHVIYAKCLLASAKV